MADQTESKSSGKNPHLTVNADGDEDVDGDEDAGDMITKRITDNQHELAFIRTEKEIEHEKELDDKLNNWSKTKKTCSHEEWDALVELQCPMPPRNYTIAPEEGKLETINTTARVYHGKFWVRHPETGIIYEAVVKDPKEIGKHQKRLDQMRAVDEYLQQFRLTSSVQIYTRFKRAVGFLEDKGKSKKQKKKEEIAYKLIPGWMDRFSFFATLLRAALNAFFIGYNIWVAFKYNDGKENDFPDNYFYFIAVLVTAGAEAYLWLMAFLRTVYNSWSLLKRVLKNDTVHFQTKNMPEQIREMASTSVLRFLPSGESTNRIRKRAQEFWDEMWEDYRFTVENARKHKQIVKIRELINIMFILSGPFLGIFALIFKIANIDLDLDRLFAASSFSSWAFYVLTYLGFVNQIASIRKVRIIEMDALQHFVFSGNDVKLSKHERQMMHVWWNFTIVSCVANICDKFKYPTFDSIVFWYQINPRKLQILLKNHDAEGVDFLQSSFKDGRSKIKVTPRQDYDENVSRLASETQRSKEKQLAESVANGNVVEDVEQNEDHSENDA